MRIFGFLFDTESAFGRLMTKIWIIVASNLLFLFFCIPVVTIGASWTALYRVMMKELQSPRDVNPFYEFWYGFKTNFRQSTVCWIAAVALLLLFRLEIYWCAQLGGVFFFVETALWSMIYVGMAVFMYLFPVIAAFENTIWKLLWNSVYLIMKKPLAAAGVALCNMVPAVMMSADKANGPTYAFVWFFCGFSLTAWVNSRLLLHVFSCVRGRVGKDTADAAHGPCGGQEQEAALAEIEYL